MDHSLRGYLERRTTAELNEALRFYLAEERRDLYMDAILMLLEVLWERERDLPMIVPSEILEHWKRLYH